ncbi:MAG: polymer-forming cytoskeletal protein [Chloroflexi bacterium]|nr:polymer-forming cytoskeletal protein [Chloroflexota bacterium]
MTTEMTFGTVLNDWIPIRWGHDQPDRNIHLLHKWEVKMKHKTRLVTLLSLFVLALLVFVPAAAAYDGRGGDTVVIGKDEVINDDLFAGGKSVVVDGTINGDLFAAGQTVTINGKVTGNVIVAGSSVTVNGEVGHDLFAAGAAVTIGPDARIKYNAYTAGASVESQGGSRLGGSLFIGAGQGLVSGQITNDLLAGVNRLRLEGTVGRDAKIAVDASNTPPSLVYVYGPNMPPMPAVQPGLTFGEEARVAGSLEYTSSKAVAGAASVSARVIHNLPPQDQQLSRELAQRQSASSYVFDALRRMVALLLIGLLLAWLAPRWVTAPAEKLLSRPLPSLGVGLVGLVAAPFGWLVALGVVIVVAVIFGLLSLGSLTGLTLLAGLPVLGLAFFAILFVLSYLCQAIVAYLGGRWIVSRIQPEWNSKLYAPLLIGLFILGLLIAVPVAGSLLQFLAILAGLGAIVLVVFGGRPAPQVAAEAPVSVQA